jgi:hypothetical protein
MSKEPEDTSVLAVTPQDDSGSLALAWFDFQLALTAQACLGLLTGGDLLEIVCEWEEDYIEVRESAPPVLVSVKHLEPSVGHWTLPTILDAGGLRHLFNRWKRHNGEATCLLRTNGGLNTGALSAAALKRAAHDEDGLDEMAAELAKRIEGSTVAETAAFLGALSIEDELPKREDLVPKLLADVIPPVCEAIGWPLDEMSERFDAVRSLVRAAAQVDLRSEGRAITIDGAETLTALARARERKTIDRQKLTQELLRLRTSSATRMSAKLDRGGLGPTDVERCKRLRADWLQFEHRWDPELPGESILDNVRREIQDRAFEAETATRSPQPYAAEMRRELLRGLEEDPLRVGDQTLAQDLALGAAYDETDRCRIWWSSRFGFPDRAEA